jgi:hypothetical protein
MHRLQSVVGPDLVARRKTAAGTFGSIAYRAAAVQAWANFGESATSLAAQSRKQSRQSITHQSLIARHLQHHWVRQGGQFGNSSVNAMTNLGFWRTETTAVSRCREWRLNGGKSVRFYANAGGGCPSGRCRSVPSANSIVPV